MEPAADRRSTARIASALYAAAASVTVLGLVLPHVAQVDVDGLAVVTALAGFTAVVLYLAGERLPPAAYPLVATLGTLLVSLSFSFNGELHGGPAGGDEAHYIMRSPPRSRRSSSPTA